MKTVRILILTAALAALFDMPAFAQNRNPGQPPDEELLTDQASPEGLPPASRREEVRKKIEAIRIWRLTEELKLDANTSARLASVLGSLDQQRRDIRHEQMEGLRELRFLLKSPKPDEGKLKATMQKIEKAHSAMQEFQNKERASIAGILTVEQQARYILFQVNFMREMRNMIAGARSGASARDGGTGRGNGPGARRMQPPVDQP